MVDVTLVITNFNKSRFIDRAIRSCLNQLVWRRSIEIIIVDDASTDNSLEVINEFAEYNVKVFANKINRGVAHASNVGLRNSTGKYWMRVDADDYLSESACEFLAQILDHNEDIHFVYADHIRINQKGFKINKVSLKPKHVLHEHGAGILMRTATLHKIGGYDENLRNCEDYDLLLRLEKGGYNGYHLPIPLYRYYIHGENITLSSERGKFRKLVEAKHGI